jgi:glucose-1-phosphate thymidylyltransferase
MKAYVLAAGYGTRMYPLTRDVPKAFLEVGGRTILDRIHDQLMRLEGLSEIVIVTNARFFASFDRWREDRDADVAITVLNDGTTSNDGRLGANRDLQLALRQVPLRGEDAVVLASDNFFEHDLAAAQRAFSSRRHTMLLVRPVDLDGGPSPHNEVNLGTDGKVLRLREKPEDPQTGLAAIALYFFPAHDLALLSDYLDHGNPDAPGHFLEWLVQRVPCYAIPLKGRWHDIGSLDSLAKANRDAPSPVRSTDSRSDGSGPGDSGRGASG